MATPLACAAAVASHNVTLGAWEHWAAFRPAGAASCHAVAKPVAVSRGASGRPFLAVASWPARGIRARIYARLSRPRAAGAPLRLTIGPRWAPMIGAGRDAWAQAGADPAIVAAMRSGTVLRIESRDAGGHTFADVYRLAGAASAIDAAALACSR